MAINDNKDRLVGAVTGAILGDAFNDLNDGQAASQLMLFSLAGSLRSVFENGANGANASPLPHVASALKNWAHLRGAPWASVHLSPGERYRCYLMDEFAVWDYDTYKEGDPISLKGIRRVRLDDDAESSRASVTQVDVSAPSNSSNASRATAVSLGALLPALAGNDLTDEMVSSLGSSFVGLVRGGAAAKDAGGLFARIVRRCVVEGTLDPWEMFGPRRPAGLGIRQWRSLKEVRQRLDRGQPPPYPKDQKHGATASEALEVALQCLFDAASPQEALERARDFGGYLSDAPMLCGALLGALHGPDLLHGLQPSDSRLVGVAAGLVDDFRSLLRGDSTRLGAQSRQFHPPGAGSLHRFNFSTATLEPFVAEFTLDGANGQLASPRSVNSVSVVFSNPNEPIPAEVTESGVHFAQGDDGTLFVHLHPKPGGDPAMHGSDACLSNFASMVKASGAGNGPDFLAWCISSPQAGAMVPGAARGLMRTAEIPRRMSVQDRAIDEDLSVFNLQRKAQP